MPEPRGEVSAEGPPVELPYERVLADVNPVEKFRPKLVTGLIVLFGATAGFACYAAFEGSSRQWSQVSALMDVVLAAEISFVSAAVTFYMTRN